MSASTGNSGAGVFVSGGGGADPTPYYDYFEPGAAYLGGSVIGGSTSVITRNDNLLVAYSDAANREAYWAGAMGDNYLGGSIRVSIDWVAETAIAGDVKWRAVWEKFAPGGTIAGLVATTKDVLSTAVAPNGTIIRADIDFTNAEMASIAATNAFLLHVGREGNAIADDMAGDAQLLRVFVREL